MALLFGASTVRAAIVFTVLSALLSYDEALAQPDATADRPLTYALVAAMGSSFSGPDTVLTPDGQKISSTTFQAPFSYLCIWILDPKTLAVISKEKVFDDQKMNDLTANPQAPVQSMDKQFAAKTMSNLINSSIHRAIRRSGLTAKVEAREVNGGEVEE